MNLYSIACAPTNLSATGIATSQTPLTAGNLTLDGAAVTAGVATMGAAQKITVTSGGNDLGRTFTITGTNADGDSQTEALTGASGAAATTTAYFKTVTQIAVDAATASTVTAGFTAVSISPTFKVYKQPLPARIAVGCSVTGTINFTLQDNFTAAPHTTWINNATVASKTADIEYAYVDTPCMAVRISVASATTGSATANFCVMKG